MIDAESLATQVDHYQRGYKMLTVNAECSGVEEDTTFSRCAGLRMTRVDIGQQQGENLKFCWTGILDP